MADMGFETGWARDEEDGGLLIRAHFFTEDFDTDLALGVDDAEAVANALLQEIAYARAGGSEHVSRDAEETEQFPDA